MTLNEPQTESSAASRPSSSSNGITLIDSPPGSFAEGTHAISEQCRYDRAMMNCNHILGEGSTLVIAEDGCSLECTECHEIVLKLELVTIDCIPETS